MKIMSIIYSSLVCFFWYTQKLSDKKCLDTQKKSSKLNFKLSKHWRWMIFYYHSYVFFVFHDFRLLCWLSLWDVNNERARKLFYNRFFVCFVHECVCFSLFILFLFFFIENAKLRPMGVWDIFLFVKSWTVKGLLLRFLYRKSLSKISWGFSSQSTTTIET